MQLPSFRDKLLIPDERSEYRHRSMAYTRRGYELQVPDSVVSSAYRSYYDLQHELPVGVSVSSAQEELFRQLYLENRGRGVEAPEYRRLLNEKREQWTSTGLRVPDGFDRDESVIGPDGREYWHRIVLEGRNEAAEILVPKGLYSTVEEMDLVTGLPKKTLPYKEDDSRSILFHFDPRPFMIGLDPETGEYDIAVTRRIVNLNGRNYFLISASRGRWGISEADSFRPVKGERSPIDIYHYKDKAA